MMKGRICEKNYSVTGRRRNAYLQAAESRIQVLKEDGKTAQSDKWMWVTRGGPPGQPSVLFEYDPSRAGKVPARLLWDRNRVGNNIIKLVTHPSLVAQPDISTSPARIGTLINLSHRNHWI
jgi:hypothetical protein